jgi:hypothetical protein
VLAHLVAERERRRPKRGEGRTVPTHPPSA